MTFTAVLDVVQRVINIVLGTVGLLLVLRWCCISSNCLSPTGAEELAWLTILAAPGVSPVGESTYSPHFAWGEF
jgi:hypothetical protein